MQENLTKIYDGSALAAPSEIIYLPIVRDAALVAIDVFTDAPVTADANFSISKNGVVVTGGAVIVSAGTRAGSSGALAVALVKGDEITLNLASGAPQSPITLNLVTEIDLSLDSLLPDQTGQAGKVLKSDGTTASWQADNQGAGGGGTSGYDVYGNTPSAVPKAEDDEFESDALSSKWVISDANAGVVNVSHNSRIKSAYYVESSPTNLRSMAQNFAPGAADFSLTVCGFGSLNENYNQFSLGVSDASNQNILEFYYIYANALIISTHQRINGSDSYGIGGDKSLSYKPAMFYLHMQRSGGSYNLYYSLNGFDWIKTHTFSGVSLEVGKAFLTFGSNIGANKAFCAVHWFRRDWIFI